MHAGICHAADDALPGMTAAALRRAIVNIRRALAGKAPHYVLEPKDRTS
jgi:hypothetical protein